VYQNMIPSCLFSCQVLYQNIISDTPEYFILYEIYGNINAS